MITERQINDLSLQYLDRDEKRDGWGRYEIDLLLKNLSREEVKAVVSAAVTILGKKIEMPMSPRTVNILWPWQVGRC